MKSLVARLLFAAVAAPLLIVVAMSPTAAVEEDFTAYASSSSLAEDHANVFRLYWAFFDRSPDASGAQYWVGQYDQCSSLLDITWSFSHSEEFNARYGQLSDEQYVDLVYANVLDREPDADGKAYWMNLLYSNELLPSEVMLYFSLGDEFRTKHPLPSDGRSYSGCIPPASAVTTTTAVAVTTTTTSTTSAAVSYANCDAVRAAGAAPLYRGEPGYRSGLDRDDDGVACEV